MNREWSKLRLEDTSWPGQSQPATSSSRRCGPVRAHDALGLAQPPPQRVAARRIAGWTVHPGDGPFSVGRAPVNLRQAWSPSTLPRRARW